MEKIYTKLNIPWQLLLIVGLAFFLRTFLLEESLFFGWEQGRDFLKLQEIVSGDLVLVGPKTDINGVFHGALSYYIPLVPFILFQGSPYLVATSYVFVNSTAIIFLYKATESEFDKKTGLTASFLYAISYSSIIYARWLSNPNLVPALVILFFFSLTKIKRHRLYLILAAVCWVIIFHLLVVVAVVLILPSLAYLYQERIKLSLGSLFSAFAAIFVGLSTYLIFETGNDFIMTRNLIVYAKEGSKLSGGDLSFVDQFLKEVSDSLFPASARVAFLIFSVILFYVIRKSVEKKANLLVLAFLFSSPATFLLLGKSPLRHFYIATPIFISIVVSFIVVQLFRKGNKTFGFVLLGTIVLGNLFAYKDRLLVNKANFIHHAQRTYLGDMRRLIDHVYQDAGGKEFTYDYYSMPYWKEDAWIYLFQWYGKGNYGYAPHIDRTNVDRTEIFYTFIEPNETVPVHLDNWYGEYKKDLVLIDTYKSGKLRVEKRSEKKSDIK